MYGLEKAAVILHQHFWTENTVLKWEKSDKNI